MTSKIKKMKLNTGKIMKKKDKMIKTKVQKKRLSVKLKPSHPKKYDNEKPQKLKSGNKKKIGNGKSIKLRLSIPMPDDNEKALRKSAIAVFGDDADLHYSTSTTSQSSTQTNERIHSWDTDYLEVRAEEHNKDADNISEGDEVVDLSIDKSVRKPAWVDEYDKTIKVSDVVSTYTKARGTRGSRETSDEAYEKSLREKFNIAIGGTPDWADLDRVMETDEDEGDEMTKHTGNYLLSKDAFTALPKAGLEFKKLNDLNAASYSEGKIIKSVEFNPSQDDIQVALVAGSSDNSHGAASLFQVDGKHNHKIHSMKFKRFPIKCARFFRDGQKFAVGSNLYGHFFVHDIVASKTITIPWNKSDENRCVKLFEVSPDGRLLVFAGNGGQLHLWDTTALSLVETLKTPNDVKSIAFNKDGSRMYTHGDGGQVYIWNMNTRSCIHKYFDDGCIDGTSIAIAPNDKYMACGSSSGIVNIYETSSVSSHVSPIPAKSIKNLVTPITSLSFNSSSEILAMASDVNNNALKLVHFPSMKVFKNFPNQQAQLRRIQSLHFSPHSGYFTAGNNGGSAHLFRLKHYPSY